VGFQEGVGGKHLDKTNTRRITGKKYLATSASRIGEKKSEASRVGKRVGGEVGEEGRITITTIGLSALRQHSGI